ncbi:MAG: DUF58 domain-containing protein [Xanthomonadales bacterium]|nr:DUF58 domain-containing protein [Xanthomonadales bacterium]
MATPIPIPAEVRARLAGLALSGRGGGGGFGQHPSRSRGAGLEFAEYRAYTQGDDPRRIDWKLYGRSDRHFVREAERDSTLEVWLLLDATASMRQADSARPDYSKLDAAKLLAACVMELALRQGDRFGVLALGGAAPLRIPLGTGSRHRDRCHFALAGLEPAGNWPAADRVVHLAEGIRREALVILLSDCFDDGVATLAGQLAGAGREVVAVQILVPDERDFPFRGGHRFVDPETGAERRVDAAAVRAGFLARFAAAREDLARRFAAAGIRLATFVTDEAADAPLRALFGAPRGSGR